MLAGVKNFFNRFANTLAEQKTLPMGELATTDSALYAGYGFRAYNPDSLVRQKGGLKVYDDMRLDEQVKACLALKKHAVLASSWKIEPASAAPEDADVAEFVEYVFTKMEGTLTDVLFASLTALDYGYAISEIVWQVFTDDEYAGFVGIKAIKNKRPHFYLFDCDAYGNLLPDGLIHQGVWHGYGESRLPVNKFVIFTNQKEFSNWYGVSDLRPAYRSWWGKDNVIRFWNIYLERFGSPLVMGKYATADKQKIQDLQTVLKNIQNKTSITLPKDFFDISFLEPQRRSTADYETALHYYDKGIARSILVPDQLNQNDSQGGGSYAKAKVHFDVFLWIIFKLREELEESVVQEQIIRRLVEYNFSGVKKLPQFKFNPLTDDQRIQLAQVFADAVQKGAIKATDSDAQHIREVLQFPESEPAPADTTPVLEQQAPKPAADTNAPQAPEPANSPKMASILDIAAQCEDTLAVRLITAELLRASAPHAPISADKEGALALLREQLAAQSELLKSVKQSPQLQPLDINIALSMDAKKKTVQLKRGVDGSLVGTVEE